MIHIVTYDLHQPGRDYPAVERVLQSADGGYAHLQGSVWLIDTVISTSDWRDRLRAAGDPNDEYFVARLWPKDWASFNMKQDRVNWLQSPQRRW